jgi:pyridoxine 5-phosphate synthase
MPELHINVDHIATIRQARKTIEPSPLEAVKLIAEKNLASGITTHLREDRRHIQDFDVYEIDAYLRESSLGFTFEMGATEEIRALCLKTRAKLATIVPENRMEITTEGGLDIASRKTYLKEFIKPIQANGTQISFFLDPDLNQISLAREIGAEFVELHTGAYANLFIKHSDSSETLSLESTEELNRLKQAVIFAQSLGLKTNLGHGLTLSNLPHILKIPNIQELHIGHSIISNSIFFGLEKVCREFAILIA